MLARPLAADERMQVNRSLFPKDHKHFISAGGLLGVIPGYYLARDPPTLQFCYSQYGKPILAWKSALPFYLTRSQGMALYAVAYN
jgi:phosphopantetheinyl transferase